MLKSRISCEFVLHSFMMNSLKPTLWSQWLTTE